MSHTEPQGGVFGREKIFYEFQLYSMLLFRNLALKRKLFSSK